MQRTMRSEADCCCDDSINSCAAIATCLSGKYILANFELLNDDNLAGANYREWSVTGGTWPIREKFCGYPQGDFSSDLLCDAGDDIALGCTGTGIAQWALGFRYSRHAPRRDSTPDDGDTETYINSLFRVNVQLWCSVEGSTATLTWHMSVERGTITGIIPPDLGSRCMGIAVSPGVAVSLPVSPADLLSALNAEGQLLAAVEEGPLTLGHLFDSGSIELLGADCGPCVSNPPTIEIEVDNTVLGEDPCDPDGPDVEINTGCNFSLSVTTGEGDAPIRECYWEDGVTGCDRETINMGEECGAQELTIGVTIIDDNGCLAETTAEVSCCKCCTPTGGYTLEFDDYEETVYTCYPDPLEAGNGCYPFPCGNVSCDGNIIAYGYRPCWYKITFDEGEVTDCGEGVNQLRYLVVVEGNIKNPDGSSAAGTYCFDPGEIFHFLFDDGGSAGGSGRIKITPIDLFGCSGEEECEVFLDVFGFLPGDMPDPETAEPPCLGGYWHEFGCDTEI